LKKVNRFAKNLEAITENTIGLRRKQRVFYLHPEGTWKRAKVKNKITIAQTTNQPKGNNKEVNMTTTNQKSETPNKEGLIRKRNDIAISAEPRSETKLAKHRNDRTGIEGVEKHPQTIDQEPAGKNTTKQMTKAQIKELESFEADIKRMGIKVMQLAQYNYLSHHLLNNSKEYFARAYIANMYNTDMNIQYLYVKIEIERETEMRIFEGSVEKVAKELTEYVNKALKEIGGAK
jgi:hypothetical protein